MVLYGSLDDDVSVAVTRSFYGCDALSRRGWSGLVVLRRAHSEDFLASTPGPDKAGPGGAHTKLQFVAVNLSPCINVCSYSRLTAFQPKMTC